jgi:hypothetical protein
MNFHRKLLGARLVGKSPFPNQVPRIPFYVPNACSISNASIDTQAGGRPINGVY